MPIKKDFKRTKDVAILANMRADDVSAVKRNWKGTKALSPDGKLININNPIVKNWLDERQQKTINGTVENNKRGAGVKVISNYDIEGIEKLTLSEIIEVYGSMAQFKGMLESLKTISEIKLKTIAAEEKRTILIDREFVESKLLNFLGETFKKLLTLPDGRSSQIVSIVKSSKKGTNQAVALFLKEEISKVLKDSKRNMIAEFKKIKRKIEDSNESIIDY